MIDVTAEPTPDWATTVFIVDQDAKVLLGHMVCAYGPVNKELEISVFPSADPVEAFEMAAFKSHHTVVDAIWGYTQFLLDEPTRKLLVICLGRGCMNGFVCRLVRLRHRRRCRVMLQVASVVFGTSMATSSSALVWMI